MKIDNMQLLCLTCKNAHSFQSWKWPESSGNEILRFRCKAIDQISTIWNIDLKELRTVCSNYNEAKA